ncbi:catenin alpha-1-like [Thunnus maccoyii]|uniref:catenin alpha-1-like n=1 Tax=Thunnus maccoyii TaxID=8240 RepID=UPI001C4BA06A|nr:catenin alpha-1-like [Thunnus maccoyii]
MSVIALQEKDVDGLDRTAGAIHGCAARVFHPVTSEMDNYEPGVYTEKVLEATKLLTNTGQGLLRLIAEDHSHCWNSERKWVAFNLSYELEAFFSMQIHLFPWPRKVQ